MAGENRGSPPDLNEKLLHDGPRFSFIQAVRLLRLMVSREMGSFNDEQELNRRIRIRPELSLGFPGTDITAIEKLSGDPSRFLITAKFLGLYGSSSPLPTFYTEDLLHEREDDRSITRDFLDIINMPIYSLFFKCWSKYQLAYKIVEEQDVDTLQRLYGLLGLAGEFMRKRVEDPYRLLRYTGLTIQFPRSAEGLRVLLSDSLGEASLRIIQCVHRVATIPEDQRLMLGQSGNILGGDSYVGLEFSDRMGKFRVRIGPADSDTLHRFLPDQKSYSEMTELIRFYMDQPLVWELEMVLRPGEVEHAGLGTERWSRLGWNTWIFSGPPPEKEMSVRLGGYSV